MADEVLKILEPLRPYAEAARVEVNKLCSGLESWQIVAYTFGFTLIAVWIWEFLFQPEESLGTRMKRAFFSTVRKLPFVKGKIKSEIRRIGADMDETFQKTAKGHAYLQKLPKSGVTEEELFVQLEKYKKLADTPWKDGACSGTVYSGEEKLTALMAKVYGQFAWSNPLHADVFPDVRKMEAEVVRMTLNMFNGGLETCGSMTSGGTESIMLACKAYRDMAYDRGIKYPEMVVPETAHAAFDKASSYFRIKIIHIAVDLKTRKVNIGAMRRAINKNTCMLAGSAPQFPHGVLDSIVEIGKLGYRYSVPVHVDSCLGGFLIPFMKEAGFQIDPFDFQVQGVTSISADTHKYGYAPKGSSVIMYSDKKYRKYQYFVQPDWPGGIYASPTFAGSRAGAIIAACWATMMYFGEDGYVDATRKIIQTAKEIERELEQIPHIFIYGKPEVSVVAWGSKDFNIYRLSDALSKKGWNLNALQFPSSIHLCITLVHTKKGVVERFVKDVKDCVREIMKEPDAKCGGQGAMYGMAQSIPDRSVVADIAGGFFDAYYNTDYRAPSKVQNGTS